MSDDRLEEAFRASLRERAGDVTADGGIAEVARAGARRRQRIKVAVAGAAAVAVIAPVGVLAALNRDGGPSVTVADPAPSSGHRRRSRYRGRAGPTERHACDGHGREVPANWRVESYDGVQLRVPPDWGWGGVPRPAGFGGGFSMCGDGAFAYPGPHGETLFKESVDMPYVGRPYLHDRRLHRTCSSHPAVCLAGFAASDRHGPVAEGLHPVDCRGRWCAGHCGRR